MKKNDINDLRNKSIDELKVLLVDVRRELSKFRLEKEAKKPKNVRQAFFQRKKIALLLTLIREGETKNA